jgi:hypothetical protein
MASNLFSDIFKKLEPYKLELTIGVLITIPFFFFVLLAWIKNDFLVVDHSYWIGVISYNIAIIFGLWLALTNRTIELSNTILYYAIAMSIIITIIFRDVAFSGDITLAVIDAAELFWDGQNPYIVEGIRHARPYPPGGFRLTTYPYLPVDLLIYALSLGIMNFISTRAVGTEIPDFLPGFNAMGILLSNIFLMIISIIFIKKTLDIEWKDAILLGLALFIILLWNNVCLAQTLFFAGLYSHKRGNTNLTVIFWTLSMLAKYFAGIFIVAYIVGYLREKKILEGIIKAIIASVITFAFLIPFDIFEVLKSTVFFYNTEERILDGSFGGSIVSEFVLFFNIASMVWIFTLFGFIFILIIAFILTDLYERLIVTSLLALCVISGISAQFLLMIIFIFIIGNRLIIFNTQKIRKDDTNNTQPVAL